MKLRVNDEYKNFCKLLDFGQGKYDIRDVFRDFVIIFAITIKNSVLYEQDDEDIYLGIIKKYEKSEIEYFIKMICELINIYYSTKEIKDVLGEIYGQIGAISRASQQFFTPNYIAKAIGKMSISESEINNREYIKIYDPACGSGVLTLSYMDGLKNNNIDYKNKTLTVARDIDFICVCMTYIQFSIYGIPGIVVLGNTLINEVNKIFYTPEFALGEWDKKIGKDIKND